jgi:hypothetical protein
MEFHWSNDDFSRLLTVCLLFLPAAGGFGKA